MRLRLTALAIGALILAGCGSKLAPAPTSSDRPVIRLGDIQFQPNALTVKVGTTVTFKNEESIAHDVTQLSPQEVGKKEPGFKSPPIAPGKEWSYTFTKPGVYPILCTQGQHYTAGMVATITVTQ